MRTISSLYIIGRFLTQPYVSGEQPSNGKLTCDKSIQMWLMSIPPPPSPKPQKSKRKKKRKKRRTIKKKERNYIHTALLNKLSARSTRSGNIGIAYVAISVHHIFYLDSNVFHEQCNFRLWLWSADQQNISTYSCRYINIFVRTFLPRSLYVWMYVSTCPRNIWDYAPVKNRSSMQGWKNVKYIQIERNECSSACLV